jgi:hypothetical protein
VLPTGAGIFRTCFPDAWWTGSPTIAIEDLNISGLARGMLANPVANAACWGVGTVAPVRRNEARQAEVYINRIGLPLEGCVSCKFDLKADVQLAGALARDRGLDLGIRRPALSKQDFAR